MRPIISWDTVPALLADRTSIRVILSMLLLMVVVERGMGWLVSDFEGYGWLWVVLTLAKVSTQFHVFS